MEELQEVTLAVGDEMLVGPAVAYTTIQLKVAAGEVPNLVVRDALAHRQAEIARLRDRVAELEDERHATAEQIADAVADRLREALETVADRLRAGLV